MRADLIDSPSESAVAWSNALISIPASRMLSSSSSAGPILSSHFYDIQSVENLLQSSQSAKSSTAHTGAPVSNVEVVLRDVLLDGDVKKPKEGSMDGAEMPIKGTLYARGPAFGVISRATTSSNDGSVMFDLRDKLIGTLILLVGCELTIMFRYGLMVHSG